MHHSTDDNVRLRFILRSTYFSSGSKLPVRIFLLTYLLHRSSFLFVLCSTCSLFRKQQLSQNDRGCYFQKPIPFPSPFVRIILFLSATGTGTNTTLHRPYVHRNTLEATRTWNFYFHFLEDTVIFSFGYFLVSFEAAENFWDIR